MFKSASEVVKYIKDNDVKFLDVRFTDLPGVQQHFNLPASMIDEDFFKEGQLFDGSSIRGFASIHESDMKLLPDVTTLMSTSFAKTALWLWFLTFTTLVTVKSMHVIHVR
jgi:glutamine synthetase